MLIALIAIAVFLASHIVLAENPCRAWPIGHLGQRAHFVLYSGSSIALIWWASDAAAKAPVVELWPSIVLLQLAPILLMPIALFLVVCGISQNNPTSIVAERIAPAALLNRVPRGILTITRNPVMWGLGLWALSHVIAGNQLAEQLRFLAFAALAILGSYRIDRKTALKWGEPAWVTFAARTSNLPFAAIMQRRIKLDWRKIGWLRSALTALIYLLLLSQHEHWSGVPAYAG